MAFVSVFATPAHRFMALGHQHAAPTSQRHVADHAAQALLGRKVLQYGAHRALQLLGQHGPDALFQRTEIDLRLRHQLAQAVQRDHRTIGAHDAAIDMILAWIVQSPARQRVQPCAAQGQRVADALVAAHVTTQLQCLGLGLLQQLVQAALFQVGAALQEVLDATREMLRHVVHMAAAVEQGARQVQQKGTLAAVELARELAAGGGIYRRFQLSALRGIG